MIKFTATLATIGVLIASPVMAGELADAGTKAEQLQASGKHLEALSALEAAEYSVWNKMPLTVRNATFITGDPDGFGMYRPRANNQFVAREPLIVYAEPVGYGFGTEGDHRIIDLTVDMELKTKSGQSLATKANVGHFRLTPRGMNREFMMKLTYSFSGLPASDYEVITTLKDAVSGKTGSFSLPFTVMP